MKISNVILISFTIPWIDKYSPYARQLNLLGHYLDSEKITWISLGQTPELSIKHPDYNITYIGGGFAKKPVVVSELNEIISHHVDDKTVLISLCDMNRFIADTKFIVPSIAWFPMHHKILDANIINTLSIFDIITVLNPSNVKNLKKQIQGSIVNHTPHMITHYEPKVKKSIRKKYKLPYNHFIVGMVFGNYDSLNRKAVDVGIFAFKNLLEHINNVKCHMYIRAVTLNNSIGHVQQLDIMNMISMANISEHVTVDTLERTYEEGIELLSAIDVLLHPSKTEGFGLPVLEAQALNIPVITSKFGAMADFTYNGISVTPLPQYEWCGSGYVPVPDLNGISKALQDVYNKIYSPISVQKKIFEKMNPEVVVNQFNDMIEKIFY